MLLTCLWGDWWNPTLRHEATKIFSDNQDPWLSPRKVLTGIYLPKWIATGVVESEHVANILPCYDKQTLKHLWPNLPRWSNYEEFIRASEYGSKQFIDYSRDEPRCTTGLFTGLFNHRQWGLGLSRDSFSVLSLFGGWWGSRAYTLCMSCHGSNQVSNIWPRTGRIFR